MAETFHNPFGDNRQGSHSVPQPILDGLAETYGRGYEAGHKAGSVIKAQEINRAKAEGRKEVKDYKRELIDDRFELEKYYLGVLATLRAQHPDITPDLPLEVLDLSERPRNCLLRYTNAKTLGELSLKSEDDLLGITNFGYKSLDEVINQLDEFGLSLKGEDPNPV